MVPKKQQIFIGSSPVSVNFLPGNSRQTVIESEQGRQYSSVIFEQSCSNFNITKSCFESKWTSRYTTSNYQVGRRLHLETTIPQSTYATHFILQWKRSEAPSSSKWSRDGLHPGENCPGSLILNIPTVYMSARKNVCAVSNLLDLHVESFMNLRAELFKEMN